MFLTKKSDYIEINNKNKPVKSKDKKKMPETKFIFPNKELAFNKTLIKLYQKVDTNIPKKRQSGRKRKSGAINK